MMLSKADFEELFPDIFPPEPPPAAQERVVDPPAGPPAAKPIQDFKYGWPAVMMANAEIAGRSLAAANQAVWNVPRTYGTR